MDGSEEVVSKFPDDKSRFFKQCDIDNECPFCYTYTKFNNKEKLCVSKNKSVQSVKKNGMTINQMEEYIAQENVIGNLNEKSVLLVKSVGSLCQECAIYIVQELVKIKNLDSNQEESQAIQDFIGNYKRCILIQNLAKCVENLDSIDTTQTTQNLLKLFGYVLPAIKKYIQKIEKSEPSRLIYTPKASKSERNKGLEGFEEKGISIQQPHNSKDLEERYKMTSKNNHPTVKPVKLMQYLCRLITPKGGTILDPFMGSGSTGIGAKLEGFNFIGIELDPEYLKIAEARINAWETDKQKKLC